MKYKLLAIDIDGTLLNDVHLLTYKNIEALKRAKELGVVIALSSGRSFFSMKKYLVQLGLDKEEGFAISFNGGMIFKGDKLFRERRIEKKLALDIIQELRKYNVEVIVYKNFDEYIVETSGKGIESYAEITGLNPTFSGSFAQDIDFDPPKILALSEYETLVKIEPILKDKFFMRANTFFSSKNLVEFTEPKSTKGNALSIICDNLGINIAETIAVGDSFNDVSMIQAAGLGIAVHNAHSDVKKYAGYVTERSNNEDALAEVIDKFILTKS